jgi:hypothetical protein
VLGEEFAGVLVSDCFLAQGYRTIGASIPCST